VRWTIRKRRISDRQPSTGSLGLASSQATAQLLHLGTQLDILLARAMLPPPKKDARAEQYYH
jgi:hypothetical protein